MNSYRLYLHFGTTTRAGCVVMPRHESHLVDGDSFAEAVMAGEVLAGDRPLRSLEVALVAQVSGAAA